MRVFTATTANEAWRAAAEYFRVKGGTHQHKGRGGPTREILHAAIVIEQPRERWVVCRQPAMNPAFALVEVLWILSGRNDSALLNFWNPLLPKYAGPGTTYYGAYGHRLRRRFALDQIHRAFQALQAQPSTRQIVLQIWDAQTDLPHTDGEARAPDIPCNICAMLKIRNGHLQWTQIMRSNDLFRGLPHNIVQFTYLQELMASWLGLKVGKYTHFSDSLHLYETDSQILDAINDVDVKPNQDDWTLDYEQSIKAAEDLCQRFDTMQRAAGKQRDLLEAAETHGLESCTKNILLCVAADAARRHGWPKLASKLMHDCTNSSFVQLWQRWLKRQGSPSY